MEDKMSIKLTRIIGGFAVCYFLGSRILSVGIYVIPLPYVLIFGFLSMLAVTLVVLLVHVSVRFDLRLVKQTSKVENEQNLNKQKILNPEDVLTKKEKVIFDLLLEGLTLRQIAGELSMKYDTVNFHYKNIYRKLEVNSKIELFLRYGNKQ